MVEGWVSEEGRLRDGFRRLPNGAFGEKKGTVRKDGSVTSSSDKAVLAPHDPVFCRSRFVNSKMKTDTRSLKYLGV